MMSESAEALGEYVKYIIIIKTAFWKLDNPLVESDHEFKVTIFPVTAYKSTVVVQLPMSPIKYNQIYILCMLYIDITGHPPILDK